MTRKGGRQTVDTLTGGQHWGYPPAAIRGLQPGSLLLLGHPCTNGAEAIAPARPIWLFRWHLFVWKREVWLPPVVWAMGLPQGFTIVLRRGLRHGCP